MAEHRKHYYNDRIIQGYFLAELIILELLLATALMVYLYFEVNHIIDSRLYQMHSVETTSWLDIFNLIGVTMGGFVVINLLALYLAHLLWGKYVRKIIGLFSSGLDQMLALDFSPCRILKQGHHRLLDLMEDWLHKEQQRDRQISGLLKQLSDYKGRPINDSDREVMIRTLAEYRNCLS